MEGREIGYTIVRAYVCEGGRERGVGVCTAVQGMCKCVAYFGAVHLLARHVPGALFMGFYKEKCYFCLVYRQLERERDGE